MADTPKDEKPKETSQPAQTTTKISAAEADILFEDVKLDKSGFLFKLLKPVLKRFSFLRNKKVWISLLVVIILMITGIGGFSFYQATKVNRPGYILSCLEDSFQAKDPSLFSSIIDLPEFSDNFINDLISLIQNYKYVHAQMGEIPDTELITDNISLLFLDIFKDNEYDNDFNNKTLFIPKHIGALLAQAQFEIKKDNDKNSHIISTTLYDDFWERIPIKLEVKQTKNSLKIVKLANLEEILQVYNLKLSKRHLQEQKFKSKKTQHDLHNMLAFLPNSVCSTSFGKVSGKDVLFINYVADPNYQNDHIVSFAVSLKISDGEGMDILEETLRSNTIVLPTNGVNMSLPVFVNETQLKALTAHSPLICKASPVMINTNSGEYFDIRKK